MSNETKYATIPSIIGFQLKNKNKIKEGWRYNLKDVVVGDIGMFDADRAEPWDPFIVVNVKEDPKEDPKADVKDIIFDVIFPRFNINENGEIEFGQDRLNEKFIYKYKCRCEIYQGGDFVCDCGAQKKNVDDYAKTFKKVPLH